VSIAEEPIPPVIWPIGTSLTFNRWSNTLIVTAINKSELTKLNRERKTHKLPTLRQYPIGAQKPGMIGVALSNAEVKQLEKLRATNKL
jgi:hypothetical protein